MPYSIDDHQLQALFARFTPAEVAKVAQKAALAGAKVIEATMKANAPVGRSAREGAYYRKTGLHHGALRATVKARRIRRRGNQARTIGYVIGPAGKAGFTRQWVEGGTAPHVIHGKRGGVIHHPGERAQPFIERSAAKSTERAKAATSAVLARYAEGQP